jgi:hypothetical protein
MMLIHTQATTAIITTGITSERLDLFIDTSCPILPGLTNMGNESAIYPNPLPHFMLCDRIINNFMEKSFGSGWRILLVGDVITLLLVTLFGFASHGTMGTAGTRMLTTFVPLVIAWLLIAPHLRLFQDAVTRDWKELWRPVWAMVLAAPLAAWLRGAWLSAPILPIFVVVLGGISALSLLVWRSLYWVWHNRVGRSNG